MIYVDELFTATPRTEQARKHGTKWSHMTCDGDLEELHRMAEKIGLRRSYFQPHPLLPHYDLVPSKRALAVRYGAQETTVQERTQWAIARRNEKKEEQAILEAARNADDRLDALLQEAIETMDEVQAHRLLDKVHQVQKEALADIQGWKTYDERPLDITLARYAKGQDGACGEGGGVDKQV